MGMAMEMQFNVNKTEEVVFSSKRMKTGPSTPSARQ